MAGGCRREDELYKVGGAGGGAEVEWRGGKAGEQEKMSELSLYPWSLKRGGGREGRVREEIQTGGVNVIVDTNRPRLSHGPES